MVQKLSKDHADDSRAPMPVVEEGLVRVLRQEGVPEDDAAITAAHLVEGTARGYVHHGVERIFEMLDGFRHGTLQRAARRQMLRDGPGYAVLTAQHGLGPPAAAEAMAIATAKAAQVGIAAVGVINASHLGILAAWVERAAAKGMLGIAMTTTEPAAVIPGGRTALLGTNPIAYAFPMADTIVSADFATTATTRSILLASRDRGEQLSLGVAVDEHGAPTTEPEAALRGGLLPLGGGLKGTLINLLVAVLAGPAIGAVANHRVTGTRWMSAPPTKGDFFVAIDLQRFSDLHAFVEETRCLFDQMLVDSPGFYIPGTGAHRRRELAQREGIPVSDRLVALLSSEASRTRSGDKKATAGMN